MCLMFVYRRLGVLVQPGNRVRFVRACVRAKLRVPAGRCCFRGWAAEAQEMLSGDVAWRGVACPSLAVAKQGSCFRALLVNR